MEISDKLAGILLSSRNTRAILSMWKNFLFQGNDARLKETIMLHTDENILEERIDVKQMSKNVQY